MAEASALWVSNLQHALLLAHPVAEAALHVLLLLIVGALKQEGLAGVRSRVMKYLAFYPL